MARGTTLLCFPHAGGSAATYARWPGFLPDVHVVALELPGRGQRIDEPPLDSMADLVADLAKPVMRHAATGEFALFGHSMGALVAFELAHRLRRFGLRPSRLLVSGHAPPGAFSSQRSRHLLPDDELWAHVRGLNGTSADAGESAEIRRLFTATIRADFAVVENYFPGPRKPLDCPISVFGGDDDPEVTPAGLAGWSAHTSRGHTVSVLPGDHFYLHQDPEAFHHALGRELGVPVATMQRGTMR